jgi:hypothetical protein
MHMARKLAGRTLPISGGRTATAPVDVEYQTYDSRAARRARARKAKHTAYKQRVAEARKRGVVSFAF